MQGGGHQVDSFFLLSGLLLGLKLRREGASLAAAPGGAVRRLLAVPAAAAGSVLRRAARLWPALLVVIAAVFAFSDTSLHEPQSPLLVPFLALSFVLNNFDQRFFGSITLSPFWSVAADFQIGAALVLAILAIAALLGRSRAREHAVRAALALAIGLGLWHVASLYHFEHRNVTRLGGLHSFDVQARRSPRTPFAPLSTIYIFSGRD